MMKRQFTVVVVGAGYGGAVFAGRLAKRCGDRCRVVVVDRAPALVERIRLHQWVSGQNVPVHPYDRLFAETPIEFRQAGVTAIDPSTRVVTIESGRGAETIPYDRLVLATGSGDSRATIAGATEHAREIATAAGAARIRDDIDRLDSGAKVVICGGGLTAIETATELSDARPDLKLAVITAGEVGASLSRRGRDHVLSAFESRGIVLVAGATIDAIDATSVRTSAGDVSFDLAIWAGGFVPGTLARESGLAVASNGQMRVDATLRSTSHPDVYGIGDVAAVDTLAGDVEIRMACATALPMGAHAANNVEREIGGLDPLPFRFGYQIQCLSLGRRDGLVQFVRHDDSPVEKILTGRLAAIVKELICRSTVFSVRSELRGYRFVWWARPALESMLRKEAMSKC